MKQQYQCPELTRCEYVPEQALAFFSIFGEIEVDSGTLEWEDEE